MITKEEATALVAEAKKGPVFDEEGRTSMFVAGYLLATDSASRLVEREENFGFDDRVGWRDLGWGTMVYGCSGTHERPPMPEGVIQEGIRGGYIKEEDAPRLREGRPGKEPCGWEHRVWLGLGCEGPPALREDDDESFIPVPFVCGTCPSCETGALQHVRWGEDEEFEPTKIPDGRPRFLVPEEGEWEALAARGYGGADYVDPTGATTPTKEKKE